MNTETASIENETSPLLKIKGLTKRFGGVIALNKVDFDVNYNEVVGLLGDNGAGKSTLLRAMTPPKRLVNPLILRSGEVSFSIEMCIRDR